MSNKSIFTNLIITLISLLRFTHSTPNSSLPSSADVNHRIFDFLSVDTHFNALSTLNSDTKSNYFDTLYQNDSLLIKKLRSKIKNKFYSKRELIEIQIIAKELQLSEIYYLQLPKLIKSIDGYYNESAILRAMNLRSINENNFKELSNSINIDFKLYSNAGLRKFAKILKLLILCSRAILTVLKTDEFCAIYYCYLYEILLDHYEFYLPLDEFYRFPDESNQEKYDELQLFIRQYHMIPWSRKSIQNFRKYKFEQFQKDTSRFFYKKNADMLKEQISIHIKGLFGIEVDGRKLEYATTSFYQDLIRFHGGFVRGYDIHNIIKLAIYDNGILLNVLETYCNDLLVIMSEHDEYSGYMDTMYKLWNKYPANYWMINNNTKNLIKVEIAEKSELLWRHNETILALNEIVKLNEEQLSSSDLLIWLFEGYGEINEDVDKWLKAIFYTFCGIRLDWKWNQEILYLLPKRVPIKRVPVNTSYVNRIRVLIQSTNALYQE